MYKYWCNTKSTMLQLGRLLLPSITVHNLQSCFSNITSPGPPIHEIKKLNAKTSCQTHVRLKFNHTNQPIYASFEWAKCAQQNPLAASCLQSPCTYWETPTTQVGCTVVYSSLSILPPSWPWSYPPWLFSSRSSSNIMLCITTVAAIMYQRMFLF